MVATLLNTRVGDYRVVEEKTKKGQLVLTLIGWDEVVHACPPEGSGTTPCCGRTPFELPMTDRMTITGLVTCQGAS